MNFNIYQKMARKTDRQKLNFEKRLKVSLLGLAGETGTLLSEYKKRFDGKSPELFIPYVKEELGDLLWYMSSVASALNLKMDEIAKENLKKTRERWSKNGKMPGGMKHLDSRYPKKEKFPRRFKIEFCELKEGKKTRVVTFENGIMIGDVLTDNAHENIGYRYHDIFHLAYAAILGWSPVLRKLLNKKRRSVPKTDEIEDGARAALTEEAIAVFIYSRARKQNLYEGVENIEFNTLKVIKDLTKGFEVERKSYSEWERAILIGYKIFRDLRANLGGIVSVNLDKKKMVFRKLPKRRKDELKSIYRTLKKQNKLKSVK